MSNSPNVLEDAGAFVLVRDVLESPLSPPCFLRILDEGFQTCHPQLQGISGIPWDRAKDLMSPMEFYRKVDMFTAGTVRYRVYT